MSFGRDIDIGKVTKDDTTANDRLETILERILGDNVSDKSETAVGEEEEGS